MMNVGRDSRLSAAPKCTACLTVPLLSDRLCVDYSLQRPGAVPQSLAALAPGNKTSVCTDWCQEKDTPSL